MPRLMREMSVEPPDGDRNQSTTINTVEAAASISGSHGFGTRKHISTGSR